MMGNEYVREAYSGCWAAGSRKNLLLTIVIQTYITPMFRLDDLYWKSHWVPMNQDNWNQTINDIASGEQWIIDGNYLDTFEYRVDKADQVILLDYPPFLCIFSFLWRGLKRYFGDQSSLPAQIRLSGKSMHHYVLPWYAFKLVFFFRLGARRLILRVANRHNVPVMLFRNRDEAR